jgi:predicted secreted Zn-dependent protease
MPFTEHISRLFRSCLDKPIVSVPFHLSYVRLYDMTTITCQVCSVPSTTIFDFFRPKQSIPIIHGVKEKFDEFINQTCQQLTITIYVKEKKKREKTCDV